MENDKIIILQAELEKINMDLSIIDSMAGELNKIYSQADDIHKHTVALGNLCRCIFVEMDRDHRFSDIDTSFDATTKEIAEALNHDVWAMRAISSIERFPYEQVEPETGLCPSEFLQRIWNLIKKSEQTEFNDLCGFLKDNLQHNYETGGGCMAGICARFTQLYVGLIRGQLEIRKVELEIELLERADVLDESSAKFRPF